MAKLNLNLGSCGAIRNYRIDASCVVYTGSRLSYLDANPGDRLSVILANLDKILSIYQDLLERGWIGKNVGDGVPIYKGEDEEGVGNLRTLKPSDSIDIFISNVNGDRLEKPNSLRDALLHSNVLDGGDDVISFTVNSNWLDLQLKPIKDSLQEHEDKLKDYEQTFKEVENKLTLIEERVSTNEGDIKQLKEADAKKSEEIKDLRNDAEGSKKEIKTLKEHQGVIKADIITNKLDIAKNSKNIKDILNELEHLGELFPPITEDIKILKEKVKKGELDIEEIKKELKELEKQVKSNTDTVNTKLGKPSSDGAFVVKCINGKPYYGEYNDELTFFQRDTYIASFYVNHQHQDGIVVRQFASGMGGKRITKWLHSGSLGRFHTYDPFFSEGQTFWYNITVRENDNSKSFTRYSFVKTKDYYLYLNCEKYNPTTQMWGYSEPGDGTEIFLYMSIVPLSNSYPG